MKLQENFSLKAYNSFGIDIKAAFFGQLYSENDLQESIAAGLFKGQFLILGGGTNMLFTGDFPGVVLRNNLKGIEKVSENDSTVLVRAAGGELWHSLVQYCVDRNWGGVENLSLIPGTVGAAPMQNIGAYGVELQDVFYSLEAMDILTGEIKVFNYNDCNFGYRNSVFKNTLKGKYFITSVTMQLNKNAQVNISYGAIKDVLQKNGILTPGIKDVSEAVISIRKSKLPDPVVLGNAGSFFKNPEIEISKFEKLLSVFPGMPSYPAPGGLTKIPAGWLIEQCGWKGKRIGNTGTHKDQALVLVNYGNASGHEIYTLAMEIKQSVKDKFDIDIYPEVNII